MKCIRANKYKKCVICLHAKEHDWLYDCDRPCFIGKDAWCIKTKQEEK